MCHYSVERLDTWDLSKHYNCSYVKVWIALAIFQVTQPLTVTHRKEKYFQEKARCSLSVGKDAKAIYIYTHTYYCIYLVKSTIEHSKFSNQCGYTVRSYGCNHLFLFFGQTEILFVYLILYLLYIFLSLW